MTSYADTPEHRAELIRREGAKAAEVLRPMIAVLAALKGGTPV